MRSRSILFLGVVVGSACHDTPTAPATRTPAHRPGPGPGLVASAAPIDGFGTPMIQEDSILVYRRTDGMVMRWNLRQNPSSATVIGQGTLQLYRAASNGWMAGAVKVGGLERPVRVAPSGVADTLAMLPGYDECDATVVLTDKTVFGYCWQNAEPYLETSARWSRAGVASVPALAGFRYWIGASYGKRTGYVTKSGNTIIIDETGATIRDMGAGTEVTRLLADGSALGSIDGRPAWWDAAGSAHVLPFPAGRQGYAWNMAGGTIIGNDLWYTHGGFVWRDNGTGNYVLQPLNSAVMTTVTPSGWAGGQIDGRPAFWSPERGVVPLTMQTGTWIMMASAGNRALTRQWSTWMSDFYPLGAPLLSLGGDITQTAARQVSFAPRFTSAAPGPFRVIITWGDGLADTSSVGYANEIGTRTHQYATSLRPQVKVKVTDALGLSATDSVLAEVPPIIVVTNAPTSAGWTGSEGVAVGFSATGSTADKATYTWNFGDGTSATGLSVKRTYTDNGTYNVVLTVRDTYGRTATVQRTAIMVNARPTGTFTAPDTVGLNAPIPIAFTSIADIGRADVATLTTSFACGSQPWSPPGATLTATCTAPSSGTSYTVRGKVTDKDGGERIYAIKVALRPD